MKKATNGARRFRTELRLRRAGHRDLASAVAVAYRSKPPPALAGWSDRIEAERARLHADQREMEGGETLGVIARRDSTPVRRCQAMAALVVATGATSVVEMGTA